MDSSELVFEQIYTKFQPKILRYLIRMVSEFDAEDLTNEVFVKVFRALNTFRGESELSTWIYRIATNTAFDRMRSPAFQRTAKDSSVDSSTIDSESEIAARNIWTGEKAPMVEPQVYRKEMDDCILSYVNKLQQSYRTVIILSEFEGLSNNAIAEVLGVTLETVKIRLHRAREKLKKQLAGSCGSEWIEGNEFVPELNRDASEYLNKK